MATSRKPPPKGKPAASKSSKHKPQIGKPAHASIKGKGKKDKKKKKPTRQTKAKNYANLIIKNQDLAIKNALAEAAAAIKGDQAQANTDYTRGKGDTDYIHSEVQDYLNKINGNINDTYGNLGSNQAAASQALLSQLQGTSQANAADASAEQNRLGVGDVGLGQYGADSNFSQLIAQQMGANTQANTGAMGANANAIAQLLQGMNVGQHQSTLGQLVNTRNDTLGDLTGQLSAAQLKAAHDKQEAEAQRQLIIQDWLDKHPKAPKRRKATHYSSGYRGGYGGGGGYSSGGGSSHYSNNTAAQLALYNSLGGKKKPKKHKNPLQVIVDGAGSLTEGLKGLF